MSSTTTKKEIPTYCKWCHKVEITFDQNRKSKSRKLIPIDKSTGLAHECDSRPKTNGGGTNTPTTTQTQEIPKMEDEVVQLINILISKLDIIIQARQK